MVCQIFGGRINTFVLDKNVFDNTVNLLFQTRESSTPKKSSLPLSGSSSSVADPLSTIQTKADAFDGLDPLSMFAAQEVSSKLPAIMPVNKKERVSWIDINRANYQAITSFHAHMHSKSIHHSFIHFSVA